jgi:two-component system nitrate/nitrite response regulator NarL
MTGPLDTSSRAAKPPLRVIVVDDHRLYRQGIVRALETAGAIVVGEAGDGRSALELIRGHQPDVALVDVSMPGLDGIDVVAELARQGPDVPVVLLSAYSDGALVNSGLEAGAAAYVTKAASREEILEAVSGAADRG